MDYPKNFEVELGQSISNALSHVSEAFSTQERLQASLQSVFEVDERLQASLQPLFDQSTKVGQVKKHVKRTKFIIRKSRQIPIREEGADFVLRVSRQIPIPDEIVVRVSRRISIPEDASEIVDGR